jgi:uncharacterized repeat protein (TIGR04042 family)
MPEVVFTIELPDGNRMECYSPSTVVRNYFVLGEQLPVEEFLVKSRKALFEASERVRAKFGFACSSAASQLNEIETRMQNYSGDSQIRILEI